MCCIFSVNYLIIVRKCAVKFCRNPNLRERKNTHKIVNRVWSILPTSPNLLQIFYYQSGNLLTEFDQYCLRLRTCYKLSTHTRSQVHSRKQENFFFTKNNLFLSWTLYSCVLLCFGMHLLFYLRWVFIGEAWIRESHKATIIDKMKFLFCWLLCHLSLSLPSSPANTKTCFLTYNLLFEDWF